MALYLDTSQSIKDRIDDLISRMTLKEKVGQLNQKMYGWEAYEKVGNKYRLTDKFKEHVEQFDGMGALYGVFRADPWSKVTFQNGISKEDSLLVTNMIQEYIRENTRMKIPVLFSEECPHGHQALESTLYPTNISVGSSWNPELYEEQCRQIARELRERGVHLGLISTLDIARDPRWGRTEECFGEDAVLASKLTESAVRGMQGTGGVYDFMPDDRVIPVLKHFIAQGAATGGHNSGPALIGERELREVFLPPMKAGIDAGALACMAAYNEIDGIPCHSNKELLTDILREEYDFKGIVMADGCAIDRLLKLTGDEELAAAYALEAGVDLSLWDDVYLTLENAVAQGKVDEDLIDKAVARVLLLKFKFKLFDEKPTSKIKTMSKQTSVETSLDMARQSIVLLENKNKRLPLSTSLDKVAVIGPNADNLYNMLGDYTSPQREDSGVTVLEGIKNCVSADTEVLYEKGCGNRNTSKEGFEAAIEAATQADVAIYVAGGSSTRNFSMEFDTNGAVTSSRGAEMDSGENVDLANLDLGGVQEELLKKVMQTGTPTVVVLIQGRPHSIPWLTENCEALINAWYPGPFGGKAISEILFGAVNPSGKMSISVPESAAQLPTYYNYKDSGAKRDYFNLSGRPLYSFGYGKSYTTFRYKASSSGMASISREALEDGETVDVSVELINTGDVSGYEVIQLYTKDIESTVTQRIIEMKDFKKVFLKAGASKIVIFRLCKESFAIWNQQMKHVVEPGNVKILIGPSSEDQPVSVDLTIT